MRGQARRDPAADAALVVHDLDAPGSEEAGQREAGRRGGLEHRRVARDARRGRVRPPRTLGRRFIRPRRYSFFFARPSLSENFSMNADDVAQRAEARDLLEIHVLDVRDLPLERREDLDALDRVDPEVGLELLVQVQDLDGVTRSSPR